jgi:prepilin-type N-terminal cleavage/methylation domain-containing protein
MNTNRNKWLKSGFTLLEMMIVIAMLVILTRRVAVAQEQMVKKQLQNTTFGTGYFLAGGSNVLWQDGTTIYTGGTNSVTLTNAQATYSPATATPISLAFAQNVPVWWLLATTSANAGTSNTVVGLDLTADGVYWTSNSVTATIAQTGTGTNTSLVYFPLNNGTNVFSGWTQARWSYAQTAQLTNVTLLQNQLQSFNSTSH